VSNLVGQTGIFQAQDNGKGSDEADDNGKDGDEADDNRKGSDQADDNGKGSDSPPDRLSLLFSFPADSTNFLSDLNLDGFPMFPLLHGDIKVRP
jgi:hypothetical protein